MCAYHHGRGRAVCTNDLRINQGLMNAAVLQALTRVLDARVLEEAVTRAVQVIRADQAKFPDERLVIERQLSVIEVRLRHLVDAVATGRATAVVFNELEKEEAAKRGLIARLSGLDQLSALDGPRMARALVDRVADVKGLLGRNIPQTRQVLRKLIPGRIVCTPFDDARGRGYALAATGTYAGLFGKKQAVKQKSGGEGGI